MSLFCKHCGKPIHSTDVSCRSCGLELPVQRNLIIAAMQGDQDAYTELFNQAEKSVRLTVYAIVSPGSAANADADDIILDSMLKGFKSLDQLKDPDSFVPWMKTIARNKSIDYLRKNRDVTFSELSSDEYEFEDSLVSDDIYGSPDMALDQKTQVELFRAILDSLPDAQRLVLTMYFYHQMTIPEIAKELGCSEATVKSRIKYAKAKTEKGVLAFQKKTGIKLFAITPALFLALFGAAEMALPSGHGILAAILGGSAGAAGSAAVSAGGAATGAGSSGVSSGAGGATGSAVHGSAGAHAGMAMKTNAIATSAKGAASAGAAAKASASAGAATAKTSAGAAVKAGASAAGKAKVGFAAIKAKVIAGAAAAVIVVGGATGAYIATHNYTPGYISDPSQISRSLRHDLLDQADAALEEKDFFSVDGYDHLPPTDTECVGYYVLTKDGVEGNTVYFLFRYTMHFDEADVEGYCYLKYEDVWRNRDGSYEINIDRYQVPFGMPGFLGGGTCFSFDVDGDGVMFDEAFLGYSSIQEFEEDVIERARETYHVEVELD